ncbi:MAG: R2-like ligand-binding oxidase [Calditrichota bacterium]
MSFEAFSSEWTTRWISEINNSQDYRSAGSNWRWPLVLTMTDIPGKHDRSIYLDLFEGQCRDARIATADDQAEAPYRISADMDIWQRLLSGELDPISSLMRGKLKLQRGKLFTLAKYGNAAKQLVISARSLDTVFPGQTSTPQAKPQIAINGNGGSISSANGVHSSFKTTTAAGLDHGSLPMQLYQKAKKHGIWDPRAINMEQDRKDWQKLDNLEKEVLIHLTALFQAGEESVTLDLLPLMMAIAKEGRIEEEMYLSTFLWEEAKHTEFFRRFLDEVAEEQSELDRFHSPSYRKLFYEELPLAMNALLTDTSPAAQVRASVTYNMVVEGTLAETGYQAYFKMLKENNLMPGMQEGIIMLKRDESRHIAYGLFLLSRLVSQQPDLWQVLEQQMNRLLEAALGTINEIFDQYETLPFGLKLEDFLDFAMTQFSHRMNRLEKARQQTLRELAQEQTEILSEL